MQYFDGVMARSPNLKPATI